eukprot:4689_1
MWFHFTNRDEKPYLQVLNMSQVPQTNDQLCKRVEQEFHSKFLSTKLRNYFIYHQFDKWNDIYDDINNGYDDCCCKIALFEQLNITNNEQKHNEYHRLKRCIEPQNTFDTIFKDIIESFTKAFNDVQSAQNILLLFNEVLENEEFLDHESVIDDVDEIENSVIISYVLSKINYNQFSLQTENVKDIICNGIKCVVENRKHDFLAGYTDNKSTVSKDTLIKPKPTTQKQQTSFEMSDISIEGIAKQIGIELGDKIKQLFIDNVNEDEFVDVEGIQDDMDHVDDSSILQYIIDNIGDTSSMSSKEIKTKIQKIVLGCKGYEADFEEKKEICAHSPPPQPITLIEKVRRRIEAMLHWEYHHLKNEVLDAYDKILATLNYSFEQLLDDVGDADTSKVLGEVNNINCGNNQSKSTVRSINEIKKKIKKIIETAKIQRPYFNITLFNFNVTKKDVEHTAAFVTEHCNLIYFHVMGVAKSLTDSYLLNGSSNKQYEKRSTIESRSLCIGKSIDFKNLKSIMNWLLQLYSKERTEKYLNNQLMISSGYSSNNWFAENEYAKWIMRTHPIIGENIRSGLAELVKRALVPMNYQHILFPLICDRLNDFVEYALAFHRVALHLKRKMEVGEFNAAPLQIDYWIIPEMTRNQGGSSARTPFDQSELQSKAELDSNNNIDMNNINYMSDLKWYKLCQEGDGNGNIDDCVWDIENILKLNCYGYISDGPKQDYFIMDQAAVERQDTLNRGFVHMIKKYHEWNSTKQRRNRYVFIIDRRNRINIKNRNVKLKPNLTKEKLSKNIKIYMIAPKQYRTEGRLNEKKNELCICGEALKKIKRIQIPKYINNKCHWCNKYNNSDNVFICPKNKIMEHLEGYILCSIECERARPNTHCKLTKEWESVPEQCLSLSKNFILVNPNKDKKPIRMDDACMGYMFGLSYHILREDNISTYFYHHGGGTLFNLNHIEKGWPQWFDKINNKPQVLDGRIKRDIQEIMEKDELKLPNLGFEEFERQCRNKSNF